MVQPSVLLHICCGPCATHAVQLLGRDYAVTGFFSNSNIAPLEEYRRRRDAAAALARQSGVPLIEDIYDHDSWRAAVAGYEEAPEGGCRCDFCFGYNLNRTATYAGEHGFDVFTTTLTISPHKDSTRIFALGRKLGPFVEIDFKKQDGFRKSVALSRHYDLYRQTYCGCEFSHRPSNEI